MRGRQLLVVLAAALVLGLLWWAQGDAPTLPDNTAGQNSTSRQDSTSGQDSASGQDGTISSDDGLGVIQVGELPAEGRDVLARIDAGGPFKYDRDGVTFENREGLLPDQPRGYYEEYTVEIRPDDRGPWRIVTGDEADEVYWTEDHYQSFSRIER